MARIDHNAKANPIAVGFLVLVLMATPLLIAVLPEETGTIVLALALPSAGITLGFINNNMGRDRKYNRKL